MSVTNPTAPATAVISPANITGSLDSTLAGLAALAPVVATSIQNVSFPTSWAGWLQAAFGVLAVFARGPK